METLAFLDRWKHDPIGLHKFCGTVLAHHPQFLSHCFTAFSQQLLEINELGKRIEFLYSSPKDTEQNLLNHKKADLQFGITKRIAWIADRVGMFGGLRIMLLRHIDNGDKTYSIRIFCDGKDWPEYLKIHWKLPSTPNFSTVAGNTKPTKQPSVLSRETDETLYDNVLENAHIFWTFRETDQGIDPYRDSEGFNDSLTTRRITLMIVHVSNILGYVK